MNIAVIGPCGAVGRQIVQQIVVDRLLTCDQRLILVANAEGASARSVFGLASDLTDAYSEIVPPIEVVLDPAEVRADLIVIAAGATPQPSGQSLAMSRDALARQNAPVFAHIADALAANDRGHEIVICVSNPNELAVATFASRLDRRRVIGMGAFLDSLRFREAIALDMGVPRQHVHAFAGGEHGANLVPLWSTVHVFGFDDDPLQAELKRIRRGIAPAHFPSAVASTIAEVKPLIIDGKTQDAYELVSHHPPDVRVAVRPFVTHYSGAKTIVGTARATMELLRTITQGTDALVSGQIALAGEVYGLEGAIGVPFVVGNRGVDRVFELPLPEDERRALLASAEAIRRKIEPFV